MFKNKVKTFIITGMCISALFAPAFPASASVSEATEQIDANNSTIISTSGITYTVNPENGEILSITNKPTNSRISIVGPGCSSTSVCLYPTSGVYYGFQYSGILNGSWPGRKGYYTGNWTTQLKWIYGGNIVTGSVIPPRVTVLFSTGSLTVTQVRIY